MTLLYIKKYNRSYIKSHPDWLFIFGDNLDRAGFGGQAKEARGEPNTLGIATKKAPSNHPSAFLSDKDHDLWLSIEKPRLLNLIDLAKGGKVIIWPLDGIGTGLAKLKYKAPLIWNDIESVRLTIQ